MSSSEEDGLWKKLTDSVTPLKEKGIHSEPIHPKIERPKQEEVARGGVSAEGEQGEPLPPLVKGSVLGLDKEAQGFFKGKYSAEVTVDLHGKTEKQAYDALKFFIYGAFQSQRRYGLIITGKGKDHDGLLYQQVPKWLNEPGIREYVVAMGEAPAKQGGAGALCVQIKRNKLKNKF